jgi:hypothetical protein
MSILFRIVGGIAIVAVFFFGTLFVLDRMSSPPAPGGMIKVIEATYGASCSVKAGNVTDYFAKACNLAPKCSASVNVAKTGDPAPGCAKDLSIKYSCRENSAALNFSIPAEANGKVATLNCGS